jgi:hypothetical protein
MDRRDNDNISDTGTLKVKGETLRIIHTHPDPRPGHWASESGAKNGSEPLLLTALAKTKQQPEHRPLIPVTAAAQTAA